MTVTLKFKDSAQKQVFEPNTEYEVHRTWTSNEMLHIAFKSGLVRQYPLNNLVYMDTIGLKQPEKFIPNGQSTHEPINS